MEDVLAITVRFALYADLALLFGAAWFGVRALRDVTGATIALLPVRRVLVVAAVTGVLLSALGVAVMAAGMAGVPLGEVDRETLTYLLFETGVGKAALARMAALALIAILSAAGGAGRRWHLANLLASGIGLGTLAWNGHAAMSEGVAGFIHLGADIVHLLAAGAWLGAIAGLMTLLLSARRAMSLTRLGTARQALSDFAAVGSVIVALLIVTGLANLWLTVGTEAFSLLPASLYGRLLIAKLVLFAAMLVLAAGNRFRLTPALERAMRDGDGDVAARSLRWSLAMEAGAAILILALVAWLGTLAPPTLV